MRVLQLCTQEMQLDLHPYVSVVVDLDADTRRQVVRALAAVPAGRDPGLAGLVEVHGVLLDLTPDNLALLDLRSELDPVVRAPDLPGSIPDGERTEGASTVRAEVERLQTDRVELEGMLAEAHVVHYGAERAASAAAAEVASARERRHDAAGACSLAAARVEAARGGRDPAAAAALEAARKELAELEVKARKEWAAGTEGPRDLWGRLAELEARRPALEAALLAAAPVDRSPLEAALSAMQGAPPVDSASRPGRLRESLEQVGVALGDDTFTDEELVQLATLWLAEETDTAERRRRLEHELAELDAELAKLRERVHIDVTPATVDPDGRQRTRLEHAWAAVVGARARLARDRRAEVEVVTRTRELEDASAAEREAAVAVELADAAAADAAAAVRAAGGVLADLERRLRLLAAVRQRVFARLEPEVLEAYLLSRLAAHRSVSYAGSVPLVLDGALAGQPPEVVDRVLDRLAQTAASVQVVVLSNDREAAAWALAVGPDRAAVVSGRSDR